MGKPFYDLNQDAAAQPPSAPPLSELSQHETSYVDFIVLGNKENYSIRADKLSILNSNTELAKMVRADKFTINHTPIDVVNFESLIRFIETKFIRFSDDIKSTLNILELASVFQCRELEIVCVKELDTKLNADNVVDIFKALRYICTSTAVTRPPQKSQDKMTAEEHLNALFYNTLQFIDQHAEDVFKNTENMLSLRFEELEIIIKRDALQIPSETIIFDLLADWSSRECERKKLEPNEENRWRVLGGLVFAPRYLNMKYDEFRKCRERVNLLDPAETQLIEDFFARKKNSNLTEEQNLMIQNFKQPRPEFPAMPIHLSERSHPKKYSKKMRKFAQRQSEDLNRNGCDACLLSCASIFACIFE